MVAIYRDPKGDKVVVSRTVVGACRQYTVTTQDERELEGLRQRVKQLQDTLKQYGSEVEAIAFCILLRYFLGNLE